MRRRKLWKPAMAATLAAALVLGNAGMLSFAAQSVTGGKWEVEKGQRYYETDLGEKLTGMYEIDGKRYAFGTDGALIKPERKNPYAGGQFVEIDEKTYFIYFNGEVAQNQSQWLFGQDGEEAYWYYYLGEEEGYCRGSSKGIKNKKKKLYMFDDQGHMISGERKEFDDGQYIYLTCAADGSAAENKWIHLDDGWHWFKEGADGFSIGEVRESSGDYTFDEDGVLTSGNAPYGEVQSVMLATGEESEIEIEVGKNYKLPLTFVTSVPEAENTVTVVDSKLNHSYELLLPPAEQTGNQLEEIKEDVSKAEPPVEAPTEEEPSVDDPAQTESPADNQTESEPSADDPTKNDPQEEAAVGDYKKFGSSKTSDAMFSLFNAEMEDYFTVFSVDENRGKESDDEVVYQGDAAHAALEKAYDFGFFTENVNEDDPYFRFASVVNQDGTITISSDVPGQALVWASIDGEVSNEITITFKAPKSEAKAAKALEGLKNQSPQAALAQIIQMDKKALMAAISSKKADYRQIDNSYMFENNVEQVIETDSEISGQFNGKKLDIVGAALNAGGNGSVKFKLSKVSDVVDLTAINKKTKIPIDLTLSCDGTSITDLEVPVLVTLPIPSGMSPSGVALYHIHNGQVKQMNISVNSSDRTVSFVTDGFSTFVFAAGDPNSNGNSGGSSGGGGGSSSGSASKTSGSSGEAGSWIQDETGWWFKKLNGSYPAATWLMTGNAWYRFDDKGYMMTGWYTDENGKKFYLNPVSDGSRGAMKTGWQSIDGKWYYFSTVSDGNKGSLLTNTTTPDGCKVGLEGVWIQD